MEDPVSSKSAGKLAEPRHAPLTREAIAKQFKALSNWGRWGQDDELGALNMITQEKRRAAASLVQEGMTISLSHDVVKRRIGVSAPFEHTMVESSETPGADSAADVYSVQYHGYTQTHLDALCHVFYRDSLYNGFPKTKVTGQGAECLSVLTMKDGIVSRGVLVDIPDTLGLDFLGANRPIYPEDLDAWEAVSGTKIGAGDVMIVRTGRWAREIKEGEWDIEKGSAGLHASCLPWIRQHDISVLASDLASDLMPSGVNGIRLPIHLVVIAAMGVPIIDNCDLEVLAEAARKRRRWEFLFITAPLAVAGGTGSPVNPLAIF